MIFDTGNSFFLFDGICTCTRYDGICTGTMVYVQVRWYAYLCNTCTCIYVEGTI